MDFNALPIHHNTIPVPPPPSAAYSHHNPLYPHMAFYWSKESQFWFSGWPDNNSGMYALALVFVFALAILGEFLSNLNLVQPGSNRWATVSFQAGFHAIRAGFGYIVILAVMSYNGGVFIAAILGHAIGYVIFGGRVFKKDSIGLQN